MRPLLRWTSGLVLVLGVGLALSWLDARLQAAALFLRFEDDQTAPAWLRQYRRHPVDVRPWRLSWGRRGRFYAPRHARPDRGVVLVHGMHEHGIDEERLVRFARAIASTGVLVGTPDFSDLRRFRVTRADLLAVDDAARLLARELDVEQVAVFGVSFGGGLVLRAACEPEHARAIGRVIALGAPHDLERAARFAMGEPVVGPGGERAPDKPHPYVRKVLEHFLFGGPVPQAGQGALGLMKQALALRQRELRALSPSSCPAAIAAPVHLAHGLDDGIIPYTETLWLQRELPVKQTLEVLVSPVIAHAEYAEPSLRQRYELVEFMAKAAAW